MKYLLIFIICINTSLASKSQTSTAKDVIKALFPSLVNKSKSPLKSKKCNFQKEKWFMMLLTREGFTEKINFNSACDIEGKLDVKLAKKFDLNFKIKGRPAYSKISGKMFINLIYEPKPLIKIYLTKMKIVGQKPIKFDYFYEALVDPLSENIIKKQTRGDLVVEKKKRHFFF